MVGIEKNLIDRLEKLLEILNDGEAFTIVQNDIKWIKLILKWIWVPVIAAFVLQILSVFKVFN